MYADNVANLRNRLTEMRSTQAEAYQGEAEGAASAFAQKLEGYTEKWDSVSKAGGEGLASMIGAHGLYSGYSKVKGLYNSVQARKKALQGRDQESNADDREDAEDGLPGDEPDTGPSLNTNASMAEANPPVVEQAPQIDIQPEENATDTFRTRTIQGDRPPGEATGENEIANTAENFDDLDAASGLIGQQTGRTLGRTIVGANVGEESEGLLSRMGSRIGANLAERGASIRQGVTNFFSRSAGDSAQVGADAAAEAAGEGGSELLAGLATGDAILGSVPIIGEAALAVSGLVAIGDGIYHLFHHPHAPPAPPAPAPLDAPTAMIAKYSMALPSSDSSVDRASSVGSF